MVEKQKFIIAPTTMQAILFCREMGWNPYKVQTAFKLEHMQGFRLEEYEVWWLDRLWPCRTHEEVWYMRELMAYARFRGADIRRWWT